MRHAVSGQEVLSKTKSVEEKMDYNKKTDSELARIMVSYIGRIENLQGIVGRYLEGNASISSLQIRREYAQIKDELREDARLVKLKKNYRGSDLYRGAFVPSISEAAASGFCVPTNGKIDYGMYSAIEEAHYRLTKYCSFEEWGELL